MPEAVASNSIPASVGQHDLDGDFADFDTAIHQLDALAEMLGAFMQEQSKTPYSFGIYSLFRQQAGELRTIYGAFSDGVAMLDASIQQLSRDVEYSRREDNRYLTIDADRVKGLLFSKVHKIVFSAWKEMNGRTPTADELRELEKVSALYRDQIIAKMEVAHDAVEAGSFLPWVEVKIRAELSANRHDDGLKVEDALARLTDDVRAKIEHAADAGEQAAS